MFSQIRQKNRQKKLARIAADLTREPEPYLEPRRQRQRQLEQQQQLEQQLEEELPVLESAYNGMGVGGDGGPMAEKVMPVPGSIYADLGGVEPVNLISFAYQIASGLVNKTIQYNKSSLSNE